MMPVLKTAPQLERLSSLATIGGISLDLTQIVVLVVIFATLVLLWHANRPSTIQRYSVDPLDREHKDAPAPASSHREPVDPPAAPLPEAPAQTRAQTNPGNHTHDTQ